MAGVGLACVIVLYVYRLASYCLVGQAQIRYHVAGGGGGMIHILADQSIRQYRFSTQSKEHPRYRPAAPTISGSHDFSTSLKSSHSTTDDVPMSQRNLLVPARICFFPMMTQHPNIFHSRVKLSQRVRKRGSYGGWDLGALKGPCSALPGPAP